MINGRYFVFYDIISVLFLKIYFKLLINFFKIKKASLSGNLKNTNDEKILIRSCKGTLRKWTMNMTQIILSN